MTNPKTLKRFATLVAATCVLSSCASLKPAHDDSIKVEQKTEFDPNKLGALDQQTVDACTRRIEKNPKDVSAYMERAATYGSILAFCQKAIADYTTVIKLDPNNAEAYDSRGKAYAWLNSNNEAIADFTKAIALVFAARTKKDRAEDDVVNLYSCYCDRGDAFFQERHYSKAIQDYKLAVIVSPTDNIAYNKLADCYSVLGQHAQAIEKYTNAIQWNKETWEIPTAGRASEYRASRQYDHALEDYDRIIAAGKADAKTYRFRAAIYKLMGRSDKAQVDIEKAETMQPSPKATENTGQR